MAKITGISPSELASMKEVKPNDSETGISESFVSVHIDEIMNKADDESSSSSPRVVSVMKKNLSRKGSPADGNQIRGISESRPDSGPPFRMNPAGGGRSDTSERAHLTVQVASGGEAPEVLRAASPAPEAERWKASRRVGTRRPPSPWLDPRRVVFVFATLSSMGTLLLLYFTLSMGKMDSGSMATPDE